MKLNICNVLYVVKYKTIPFWHNHLCFFNSIDQNFYQYNWGTQDPCKGGDEIKRGVIKPIVNYDAKLNSHYEAWSYKEKKHKNIKAHKNSV